MHFKYVFQITFNISIRPSKTLLSNKTNQQRSQLQHS